MALTSADATITPSAKPPKVLPCRDWEKPGRAALISVKRLVR